MGSKKQAYSIDKKPYSDNCDLVLKPYIRKHKSPFHVQPINIPKEILVSNPYDFTKTLDNLKAPQKECSSLEKIKEKLASVAAKKSLKIREPGSEPAKKHSLLSQDKKIQGVPTFLAHKVGAGISKSEASKSLKEQYRHTLGIAASLKRKEEITKEIEARRRKLS